MEATMSDRGEILIEPVHSATDEVRALVAELEHTLAAEYPPEQRHGLALGAIFQPHIRFFLARLDGDAVGCGGVALFADFAEVKRMYVRDVARGRGVARTLLARIELAAREAALAALRLETGDRQIAAMRLYERAGFRRCPPFGDYAAMATAAIATSVFFEKSLAGEDQAPG
jgi:putative acetyltransferase